MLADHGVGDIVPGLLVGDDARIRPALGHGGDVLDGHPAALLLHAVAHQLQHRLLLQVEDLQAVVDMAQLPHVELAGGGELVEGADEGPILHRHRRGGRRLLHGQVLHLQGLVLQNADQALALPVDEGGQHRPLRQVQGFRDGHVPHGGVAALHEPVEVHLHGLAVGVGHEFAEKQVVDRGLLPFLGLG